MAFTISDLKTRLESKIHARNIDQVNDVFGLIYEGAGNVLGEIDPRETKRITSITNALYDRVYDYIVPTDLKSDAVIDIRPQTSRAFGDALNQSSTRDFDRYLSGFSVEDNSGVRTIKIAGVGLTAGPTINECESLTANGTWAASGNATVLASDTFNKMTGNASLKFDISASGTTAIIENSTMTQVDLTNYVNTGAIFVWVYIPSITIITSVNLRWGNDSSNYNNRTVSVTQDNTAFVVGWNLLRFDWSGSTAVGTVVATTIDYLRVTFNYDGTATTSCRVDSIVARLGAIYEMVYYSGYLFRTSGGTWIEKPTADTDLINLDIDGINLLLYEVAELVAMELQKKEASFDVQYWTKKKKETWDNYKQRNKSQALKRQRSYYHTANNRRR